MSYKFPLDPLHRFRGDPAAVKKPVQLACYSHDEEHRWRDDDASLRYYYPATLGEDLFKGSHDKFIRRDDSVDEHLDHLLRAIVAWEKKNDRKLTAELITWVWNLGSIWI